MTAFITLLDAIYTETKTRVEDDVAGTYLHLLEPEFYEKRSLKPFVVSMFKKLYEKVGKDSIKNKDDGLRAGLIFSSGNAGFGYTFKYRTVNELFKHQTFSVGTANSANAMAGTLASMLEYFDYVATDATACLSSGAALMTAQKLIDTGELDRVIIIAIEDPIKQDLLEFFVGSKACASITDEDAGKTVGAFDDKNFSFYLGQAAGVAIIENEKSIQSTGRKPIFEVVDATLCSEKCSNPVGMTEDGQGYKRVLKTLFGRNSILPSEIDIIKPHGSGTLTNNKAEGSAIIETFAGTKAKVTSYKQYIGHTFGPSFLVELYLLNSDINSGILRPIKTRSVKDDFFISDPTDVSGAKNILCLASAISNSFFGAILKKM